MQEYRNNKTAENGANVNKNAILYQIIGLRDFAKHFLCVVHANIPCIFAQSNFSWLKAHNATKPIDVNTIMANLKAHKSVVNKFETGVNLPNLTSSSIETGSIFKRRTATDEVFDGIYADIMSLTLKPGTKISEVEVAKQYNVSRHPIRDAFTRLSNLGLILIRPQRATVVRRISLEEVSNARFLRMAIELEVARAACSNRASEHLAALEANLEAQKKTVETGDFREFQILDVEFHKLLCVAANREFAFQSISQTKTQIDRLCTISLSHTEDFTQAYEDHIKIFECLKSANVDAIAEITRAHMSRLDPTIVIAKLENEDYFTE